MNEAHARLMEDWKIRMQPHFQATHEAHCARCAPQPVPKEEYIEPLKEAA